MLRGQRLGGDRLRRRWCVVCNGVASIAVMNIAKKVRFIVLPLLAVPPPVLARWRRRSSRWRSATTGRRSFLAAGQFHLTDAHRHVGRVQRIKKSRHLRYRTRAHPPAPKSFKPLLFSPATGRRSASDTPAELAQSRAVAAVEAPRPKAHRPCRFGCDFLPPSPVRHSCYQTTDVTVPILRSPARRGGRRRYSTDRIIASRNSWSTPAAPALRSATPIAM